MRIGIGGNHIGAKGAAEIAGALKVNTVLLTLLLCNSVILLNLGNNELGEEGGLMLADAVKLNPILYELWAGNLLLTML